METKGVLLAGLLLATGIDVANSSAAEDRIDLFTEIALSGSDTPPDSLAVYESALDITGLAARSSRRSTPVHVTRRGTRVARAHGRNAAATHCAINTRTFGNRTKCVWCRAASARSNRSYYQHYMAFRHKRPSHRDWMANSSLQAA